MRNNGLGTLSLLLVLAACATPEDGMQEEGERSLAMTASLVCEPTQPESELARRASPYDSAAIDVGSGHAKICYSRPSLKGRTMIGGDAVPYGQLWRTGANEPTIIHLSTAAEIAGLRVEPGKYSLYTIPRETGPWTLIVNRSTSQWGHEARYTEEVEAQEVGRAEVAAERIASPVETFTIRPIEGGGGVILEWQNTRIRVPIQPAS